MNHIEFYNVSIDLDFSNSNNLPSEISIRNSISRIYYYIYHETLKWVNSVDDLEKIYIALAKTYPSSHKRLAQTFAEYSKQTQILEYGSISRLLVLLHNTRCEADYTLDDSVSESQFFSFIANLETLKQRCQKIYTSIFQIDTNLKSVAVTNHTTAQASIQVVKRKPTLRVVD